MPAVNKNAAIGLVAIVGMAALFYFWQLGRADIITDESSYATRAIGMVDFDFGIEQPTPWQWVNKIPWWMRLSFHDHPPLVFLLQHYSIKFFGENPTAVRIPSALAGIASVVFIYSIGRRLYSPAVGAISSLLFAVTANHVWISRIGLQESILIALMLAAVLTFLKGLERSHWLMASGALLGFAALAKYNALILLPIFLTVLAIRRRDLFKNKWLLLAVFCFLFIVSPVIVYNIQLWRNFGHFDFQFSLLFGQEVDVWQSRPGQEVLGSYADRVKNFIPWLVKSNSPYFLFIATIGLAIMLGESIRRRSSVISHWLLAVVFFWLLPFFIFIGPAPRFLTLLTPWLVFAAGYGLTRAFQTPPPYRGLTSIGVALLVAFEIFYSYNSVISLNPIGPKPWAYSHLRRQSHSWGFNQLNAYLDQTLKGRMPDPAITFEFAFAREILNRAAAAGKEEGRQAAPWGIVYDGNINLSAQLWVFLRRITYQGWPIADAETFGHGGGQEFFRDSGVKTIFFVAAADFALKDRPRIPTPDADSMEAELIQRGVIAHEVKTARGEIAFRVYPFEL